MKNPRKTSLKSSLLRLLALLLSLDEEGYEVTANGFCKIALGILDEETRELTTSKAFASLPSLGSKRLKMRLHQLVRKDYVRLSYDETDEDYYLSLSEDGRALAERFPLAKKETKPATKRSIRQKA